LPPVGPNLRRHGSRQLTLVIVPSFAEEKSFSAHKVVLVVPAPDHKQPTADEQCAGRSGCAISIHRAAFPSLSWTKSEKRTGPGHFPSRRFPVRG
jgi:hypothetical protein